MPAGVVCPIDGTRLVLVTDTNASGDQITRYECPVDDWAGPWYSGEESGDNESIPEVSRRIDLSFQSGSSTPGLTEPVSVDDNNGSLTTDGSYDNRFKSQGRTTEALSIATSGDNTIVTPAAGQRLRVFWIGLSVAPASEVVATVKFGAAGAAKYIWTLGAFMHWETIEGSVDAPLIVNLNNNTTTKVNVTYEEFT